MNSKILFLVCGITILITMGISSIIPSLPLLVEVFSIRPEASWRIVAAFAFPGLIGIPLAGALADRYGRKAVLIPSLLLFAIGGMLCAFAGSYTELLLLRMLQGAGSAPLSLLYTTIIADTWQGKARIRAMSYTAASLGMGTALSPALGGALAIIDWRLPFTLPLLALPLLVLALPLPLMKPGKHVSMRSYARSVFEQARQKQTLVLLALTLLTFVMLSGPIITCLPLLADQRFGASPLETGMIIACASLASGVVAAFLPRLYTHWTSRGLLLVAMLLYGAGFCFIALCPSLWLLVVPITLYGFGQGLNIPLVSTLLSGQAEAEQRAAIMAANGMLLRLGQNIGPAVFGTLAGGIGPAAAIACGSVIAAAMAVTVIKNPLPSITEETTSP